VGGKRGRGKSDREQKGGREAAKHGGSLEAGLWRRHTGFAPSRAPE